MHTSTPCQFILCFSLLTALVTFQIEYNNAKLDQPKNDAILQNLGVQRGVSSVTAKWLRKILFDNFFLRGEFLCVCEMCLKIHCNMDLTYC